METSEVDGIETVFSLASDMESKMKDEKDILFDSEEGFLIESMVLFLRS